MTSERLSDGEKVVWAAIFARQFLDGVADSSVSDLGDGAEDKAAYERWEKQRCGVAVETSCIAIQRLRGIKDSVSDEFYEDSAVSDMLMDILDEK